MTPARAGIAGALVVLALSFAGVVAAPAWSAPSVGFAWGGQGGWGELGDGKYGPSLVPVQIADLDDVVSVAAGNGGDGLALLANGTVWAWGKKELSEKASTVPVQVPGLSEVTAIATDGFTGLALVSGGTVMEWGYAPNGNEIVEKPHPVGDLSGVVAISVGGGARLALLSNGTVMAWGEDGHGQLGDGTTEQSRATPVQVHELSDVTAVAAGDYFALALLDNGEVRSWGSNRTGQLGAPCGCEESTLPTAVPGIGDATAISAGGEAGYALLSSGEVEAWGSNFDGELGDGNTKRAKAPVMVTELSDVKAISAGSDFSLALLASGTVEAWGSNLDGELGDDDAVGWSDTPTPVCGLEDVSGISAGFAGAYAWGPPQEGCEDRLSVRPWGEFGRCMLVGAGKGHDTPGCTGEPEVPESESYEWYPAFGGSKPLESPGFTLEAPQGPKLETAHGTKISCSGAAGSGEYTGLTTVAVNTLALTGCKQEKGGVCSSAGAGAGEVELSTLSGQLSKYAVENSSDADEGIELSPPEGDAFAEFTCAGVPVSLQGSLIAQWKTVGKMTSRNTWVLAQHKGVQNPTELVGAPEATLAAKVGAGSYESIGIKAKLTQTNAEPVEEKYGG